MTSPTQRTLKRLRDSGWIAEVVEKRIPKIYITKDLFGCIDILAIRDNQLPLAIQATGGMNNRMPRIVKSMAQPALKVWLSTGCRFEVWVWRKLKRKNKGWTLHKTEMYLHEGQIGYGEVNEG